MPTIIYTRPVYYYETDRMDCVHHSNYIRWFEEARIQFMSQLGFPYEGLEAAGIVSPVLSAEAHYHTMCRFGDTVEILTGLEGYSRTRIAFFYQVRDKATGQLRCDGRTNHCFLLQTGQRAGRPVSLHKAMPAYHQRVMVLLEKEES
jgi:acyl-CoA thioester hydrolase